MRILCDMDAIVADLLTPWLLAYNQKYADNLTVNGILDWDLHQFVKPECGLEIYALLKQPGLFLGLAPIPGAIDAIHALEDAGHSVTIVTAGASSNHCPGEKLAWCKRHLGFSRRKVFIGHEKHLLRGDVFIDDSPVNITEYRAAWPQAEILTIAYPYNARVSHLCRRFEGWQYPAAAWRQIVRSVI
jgi:5'-nucleotidase